MTSAHKLLLQAVAISVAVLLPVNAHADCHGTIINNIPPTTRQVSNPYLIWPNATYAVELNVPPRYMWGWGSGVSGYCGSFSAQSWALYYGSWISAGYFRRAAVSSTADARTFSEVLLGDDDYANIAQKFALNLSVFNNSGPQPQIDQFLNWTATNLFQGSGVIAGVFERKPSGEGDPDYDHIVPIIGLRMNAGGAPETVLYNDLWATYTRNMTAEGVLRDEFVGALGHQPYHYALPREMNFGVAIHGPLDPRKELYPTKLTAWSHTEPDWGDEDDCDMPSKALQLSAAVYGLKRGDQYSILRFNDSAIPTSNFLQSNAFEKRWDFVAEADVHEEFVFDTIPSKSVKIYRTVLLGVAPTSPPAGQKSGFAAHSAVYVVIIVVSFLVVVAVTWYMTRRYWAARENEALYDPTSPARNVVKRAKKHSRDASETSGLRDASDDHLDAKLQSP